LVNNELKILSGKLRDIFREIYNKIKNDENINDRNLDDKVLSLLKDYTISEENLKIKFSEPKDEIYSYEGRRTPYDLLCYGIINGKNFLIFINNKFGDLKSNTRNDVTTYNNLLRLYLGIKRQRLTSEITINGELVYNRISGNEIVSYGIFVVDKYRRGYKFFLLEEIKDDFYVNPRNNMFQIRYSPNLGDPIDYFAFVKKLIDAILESLEKSLNSIKTEILVLNSIKIQLINIKEGKHGED